MAKIYFFLILLTSSSYLTVETTEYNFGVNREQLDLSFKKLTEEYLKFSKMDHEIMKLEVVNVLKNYCKQIMHLDYDTNAEFEKELIIRQYKTISTMKGLHDLAYVTWEENPDEVKRAFVMIRDKYCAKLINVNVEDDDEEDDEMQLDLHTIIDEIKQNGGEILSNELKKMMLLGWNYITKKLIKFSPLQCVDNSCKTCVGLRTQRKDSFCVEMSLIREIKSTLISIVLTTLTGGKVEKQIELGDIPRCLSIPGFPGNICLRGIYGKATVVNSKPSINFCLLVLAEKYGFGIKLCAAYENYKLKMRLVPELFAGGRSDHDDDIIELHDNEMHGKKISADA